MVTTDTNDARVYLLTGSETGRKKAEAQVMTARWVDSDFADFDSESLDGNTATADLILGGAAGVPMGEGKRVVLVRDAQQMDADEQKKLAANLSFVPSSGIVILLTGAPVIEDGKTRRQSVVLPDLAAAVKKTGKVLDFGAPRAEDLRDYLRQAAQAVGKTLSSDAVSLLTSLSGEDLRRVGVEIEKAAAYAGDSPTITAGDLEATMSRSPDDVIFKLCDAIGSRQTAQALVYTNTLFRSGQKSDAVAARSLVLLARQIRLLAQFRYLADRKLVGRNAPPLPPDVVALLPLEGGAAGIVTNARTSWMADKYVTQARNFSGSELAERLEKLLHADLSLKGIASGGDNAQAILQKLVIELC